MGENMRMSSEQYWALYEFIVNGIFNKDEGED